MGGRGGLLWRGATDWTRKVGSVVHAATPPTRTWVHHGCLLIRVFVLGRLLLKHLFTYPERGDRHVHFLRLILILSGILLIDRVFPPLLLDFRHPPRWRCHGRGDDDSRGSGAFIIPESKSIRVGDVASPGTPLIGMRMGEVRAELTFA